MTEREIKKLHMLSRFNANGVKASEKCGCFSCRTVFPATEVEEWVDNGRTAICPHCGTDALLPDCDVELTDALLAELYDRYFAIDVFDDDLLWAESYDDETTDD